MYLHHLYSINTGGDRPCDVLPGKNKKPKPKKKNESR